MNISVATTTTKITTLTAEQARTMLLNYLELPLASDVKWVIHHDFLEEVKITTPSMTTTKTQTIH